MRITHLITDLGFGGAENSLLSLVEATHGSEIKHTVISMLPQGTLRSRLERSGARVIELTCTRGISGTLYVRSIDSAIKESRPDLLQCWMYHANIAASILKMGGRIRAPIIWGVRQGAETLKLDTFTTRGVILIGAPLSLLPERIVYNSVRSAEEHERLGYRRASRVTILNGIDCDRFRPCPGARENLCAELGFTRDAILIGRVARYAPMKDYPTMLRAFASVARLLPEAQLIIIGPSLDDDRKRILASADELGCHRQVHVLKPRIDIETFYPALDVLVSSSRANEGFPNAIAEALACGTLVASTAVGESQLVRTGCHRVVRPSNPDELSSAILDLIRASADEKAELASRGRAFIINNFSKSAFATAFMQLWAEVSEEWQSERTAKGQKGRFWSQKN